MPVSGNFEYQLLPDGNAAITGYEGQMPEALHLLSEIGGRSVTAVGDRAFSGCLKFCSIVIPEGVTSVGTKAFLWCTALRSVLLLESTEHIGRGAFCDCDSLESVLIPKCVTAIGAHAFGFKVRYSDDPDDISLYYDKAEDFRLACYAGTAGQAYAEENGFSYTLMSES